MTAFRWELRALIVAYCVLNCLRSGKPQQDAPTVAYLVQFFFKRWSDYEESLGDAAAVERVKQLATEYIESRQREA